VDAERRAGAWCLHDHDGGGGQRNAQLSATNSFTVTVNEVNVAPVLTLPPNTNIAAQVSWSAMATATDSDIPANPLTFGLVSGPAGLTVATNGIINWTPTGAQGSSNYTVTISVTDTNPAAVNAKSLSVTNSFQIAVGVANLIPLANNDLYVGHRGRP